MEAAHNMLSGMEKMKLAPTSKIFNIMMAGCFREVALMIVSDAYAINIFMCIFTSFEGFTLVMKLMGFLYSIFRVTVAKFKL